VSRAARQPGSYDFPAGAADLEPLYRALYRLCGGAMTPLIGGSLAQLGYDGGYSLRPLGPPVAAPRWEDVLEWSGTVLTTRAPVMIDVGAAGKGQLADLLSAELSACGIGEHFIDASGDLLNSSRAPVEVALEHPYDTSRAIGTLPLSAGALCASAANRRVWGDGLHHVLDGTTGAPVRTVVASWAMAGTAMLADALATALFFVEGTRLREEFEFSWLTVYSDGHAEYSADFEGALFT
jgi:thiamine biosynthesis lipoprotein